MKQELYMSFNHLNKKINELEKQLLDVQKEKNEIESEINSLECKKNDVLADIPYRIKRKLIENIFYCIILLPIVSMLIYIILNNIIELQANDFIKCFAISIPFVLIICSIKHSNDTRNYKVRIKNFNHEKCDNQINQLKEKLKKMEIEENSIINEIKILNNELKIIDNEIKPEFVDIK